jgi:hypothetical protein
MVLQAADSISESELSSAAVPQRAGLGWTSVLNRGERREAIFSDAWEHEVLLQLSYLAAATQK